MYPNWNTNTDIKHTFMLKIHSCAIIYNVEDHPSDIYIYVSAKFGFNYFSSFWEKDWKTKHGKGQLMQTTTSTTEIKWWQQW